MSRRYHVCIHNGWLMHLIKIFSLSWSSYISFVIKHCHSISTYVLPAMINSMVRKIFCSMWKYILIRFSLCYITWHILLKLSYCATVVHFRELSNSTEYCWITSIPLISNTSLISIFNRSTSMNLMQSLPDLPQSLP